MPKQIPHSLAESLPPQDPGFETADALRVHEGVGLPGEETVSRIGGVAVSPEMSPLEWGVAKDTHEKTAALFADIVPLIKPPELQEFVRAEVDFPALKAGYEAYRAAGLEPELLFFPVNMGVSLWKEAYGLLRQWQETNVPDPKSQLSSDAVGGDGLWITSELEQDWSSREQEVLTSPIGKRVDGENINFNWKALVVPTAGAAQGGIALNTRPDLTIMTPELQLQFDVLGSPFTAEHTHMPTAAYLTLQAMRVAANKPLIDRGTRTVTGPYKVRNRMAFYPVATYNPLGGQIVIRQQVNHENVATGVRLPVWG